MKAHYKKEIKHHLAGKLLSLVVDGAEVTGGSAAPSLDLWMVVWTARSHPAGPVVAADSPGPDFHLKVHVDGC